MSKRSPEQLLAWDRAHVWHPFTQMEEWEAQETLIIERGEGPWLFDVHGRRFLDGVSSLWCNVHGHRHPRLDAALREQAERVAHTTLLGLASVPSIELARRLVEIAPAGLSRVFYSDAGATAVEVALKIAAQFAQLRGETERTRFAALTESYHGDTIGAVSLGFSAAFHRFHQPLLFPCLKTDPPHVFRWERGVDAEAAESAAIEAARDLFSRHGETLAAFIVEPLMQGAAGMWNHSPRYLRELRSLTREHGVLLICDEVATGFGRTGTMFAVEQADVQPDLLCLAKGLSGGYLPLAATLATEELFDAFRGPYSEGRTFFHGHTFTGNPLACAVALASLDVFEEEGTLENVRARSRQLGELLEREVSPLAAVGDIRRHGLMTGIELVRDRTSREPYATAERIGVQVILAARRRGVILRPLGSVLVLMPPLNLTADQIEELVEVTRDSIREVTEEAGRSGSPPR